jgi:hypothetical protein
MRPIVLPVLLCLTLSAAGAARAAAPASYGAPMPAGDPTPIGRAIDALTPGGAAAAGKYSGRITEVCQAKGCWLMLEQDGKAARVTMKDYGFVLPKDARGTAVVHGELTLKELDEATAKHLAEDAGRSASGPMREYRIVAASVELQGD